MRGKTGLVIIAQRGEGRRSSGVIAERDGWTGEDRMGHGSLYASGDEGRGSGLLEDMAPEKRGKEEKEVSFVQDIQAPLRQTQRGSDTPLTS